MEHCERIDGGWCALRIGVKCIVTGGRKGVHLFAVGGESRVFYEGTVHDRYHYEVFFQVAIFGMAAKRDKLCARMALSASCMYLLLE